MQKATGFEHGSEQETAPWKVQIGVKAVHPSGLSLRRTGGTGALVTDE